MSAPKALRWYIDNASISPDVYQLCPDYRALLIAMDGITTGELHARSESMLCDAEATARTLLQATPVTALPHIAAWREAYKAFGAKPNKFRNSLEALTRRVESGLPRVNPLTDIYNAISVKHQIPLGGEDLDRYNGAPYLMRASGKEVFETTSSGEKVEEHPDVGEVVWCDDAGVTCRRWNWRQGPRTALTHATSRVLFILDVLKPVTDEQLQHAGDELINAIKQLSPQAQVETRLLKNESA